MTPTKDQVLAASAGWVAVVLNVVPGLGAGITSKVFNIIFFGYFN